MRAEHRKESGVKPRSEEQALGIDLERRRDAVFRWYRRRIGIPHQILTRETLAYEPRSAHGCVTCHGVLVGVKSGHLYRIGSRGIDLVESMPFPDGIYSVWGCLNPRCAKSKIALVGDGKGNVHVFRNNHDQAICKIGEEEGRIISLKLVRGPAHPHQDTNAADQWVFAATDRKKLFLVPLEDSQQPIRVHSVDRSVWWIRREGSIGSLDPDGDEYQWLLISTDGHSASVRFYWDAGAPEMRQFNVGRLRETPLYVSSDRHVGKIRSIIYGSESGLRAALIDEDGFRVEKALLPGRRIAYCRIVPIFEVDHIIACGDNGQIWSRPWSHPEDSHEDQWFEWPRMPSDALFVEIREAERDKEATEATLILRNHSVYKVRLYNRDRILETLRKTHVDPGVNDAPVTTGIPWERKTDEERDAECLAEVVTPGHTTPIARLLSLARFGGTRTLAAIITSLSRFPTPTYAEALSISVTVMAEASRHGRDAVRALAERLHRRLLALLRETSRLAETPDGKDVNGLDKKQAPEDRDRLERWVVFLKKHFVMAHTFSEKRCNLVEFQQFNAQRPTPDALIYEARLRAQGFDVLWEQRLFSPVMAMAHSSTGTGRSIGLSQGEGRIMEWAAAGSDLKTARLSEVCCMTDSEPFQEAEGFSFDSDTGTQDSDVVLLAESRPRRIYDNYSRVLHHDARKGKWVLAPRKPASPAEEVLVPDLTTLENSDEPLALQGDSPESRDSYHQAYSLMELPGSPGRYLIGLRDIEYPLAVWDSDAKLKRIRADWGTSQHVRQSIPGGERRVWSIASVSDRGELAFACEDGYLRLGRIEDSGVTGEVENPWRFLPVKGGWQFLGGAIRSLASIRHRAKRYLLAGTETGDLFCFEVTNDTSGTVELNLKFRDLLEGEVLALFALEFSTDSDDPACEYQNRICALDSTGTLTTFGLPNPGGIFLGKRTGEYRVADGATTAIRLEQGKLLVAGWNRSEDEGWLRCLSFDQQGKPLRSSKPPQGIEAAKHSLLPFGLTDAPPPGSPSALEVLSSLPLEDGSLRATLVGEHLARTWTRQHLEGLRDLAIRAYPDDLQEVESLLSSVSQLLELTETGVSRLRDVHRVFIVPEGRYIDRWVRDPRIQVLVVRSFLTARSLVLWERGHLGEAELSRWIDRNLQHRSRSVQIATLRAIAEALLELRRLKRREAQLFKNSEKPPVSKARSLLAAIARFLYVHPSMMYGSECDASTWAAVSVLVNGLRLVPDSALVIYDHISSQGVNPLVFGVLLRRLTSTHDLPIRKKLNRCLPIKWIHEDPTIQDLHSYTADLDGDFEIAVNQIKAHLGIQDDDPDCGFIEAYTVCYSWFAHVIRASSPEQLAEECEFHEKHIEKKPNWAMDLDSRKDTFMGFTTSWIKHKVIPALQRAKSDPDGVVEAIDDLRAELAAEIDQRDRDYLLFAPETRVLRTVLLRCREILLPTPPSSRKFYGKYQLGRNIPNHSYVFEVDGDPEKIIRFFVSDHAKERAAMAQAWKKVKSLQESHWATCLAPIDEVLDPDLYPGMVMQRVGGDLLHEIPASVKSLKPEKRWWIAFNLTVSLSRALQLLHEHDLAHGDVWQNVLADLEGHRFWLIDFGRLSSHERLDLSYGPTPGPGGDSYPGLAQKLTLSVTQILTNTNRLRRIQAMDIAASFQLIVNVICGESRYRGITQLPLGRAPQALQEWGKRLDQRHQAPQAATWTAQALYDEATGDHMFGVFLAGDTQSTQRLKETLSQRALDHWFVHEDAGYSGRPMPEQLIMAMLASRTVVLLVSPLAGTPMSVDDTENLPWEWLTTSLDTLGVKQPAALTWTQFECLLAMFLEQTTRCKLFFFTVSEPGQKPEPADMLQVALWKRATDRGTVLPPDDDGTTVFKKIEKARTRG